MRIHREAMASGGGMRGEAAMGQAERDRAMSIAYEGNMDAVGNDGGGGGGKGVNKVELQKRGMTKKQSFQAVIS